ncbi:DUF4810 domain-containing protein [Anaeromyxobacter oryzisoli]|uniref:DUF4810 domain-containing protein n=1 Tax=Anaeromyxobacter oryzisoli TaxID=2925408 RepID=UPI001F5775C5|nr:DUF4810 domain-containing protein [Anaeromyxobacter sp. SG63]
MRAPVFAFAVALAVSGCAARTTYHWGSYDETLYKHYKRPLDREAWVAGLEETVLAAEQDGERVPPGVYAELGYALLEEGQTKEAISYFEKEKTKWPESRVLMEKMIRNAQQRAGNVAGARIPASTRGPAGAVETKR